MTTSSSSPRVVVIGGGILGISTATQLAAAGAAVTLVTESTLNSGASGRSLSWLNSAGERSAEYHALRLAGIDRYRTLVARTGGVDAGGTAFVRFDGGLTWAGPDASYRERHLHEKSIGYDSRWLSPDDVASWTPGVDATAINPEGAIFNPGEGWVDLPMLGEHLLAAFRAAGGVVRDGVGRTTVQVDGGRATGALTASGETIPADHVVLATGPWVPRALSELGIEVGEQTPISLLVATKPVDVALTAVLNTPRVAVRPTPHGHLVLDSGWSEDEVADNGDGTYTVHDSTVEGLLAEASRVLAGSPTLELAHYGVGPKPIPADGDPLIGAIDEIEGLHAIFTHSGATLALIVGELVADEIVTGQKSPLLTAFGAGRFAPVGR